MGDDTNVGSADNDDLNAFENEFYGRKAPEPEDKVDVRDEDGIVDDQSIVEKDSDDVADEDASESDESHESEEDVDGRQEKKKRSAQERINELTREKYEATRRELDTQRKLQELQEELTRLRTPKEEPSKAKVEAKDEGPTPDDKNEEGESKYPLGEFDPQYLRDLAKYEVKRELTAAEMYRQEAERKAAQEAAQTELDNSWKDKVSAEMETVPDLAEKIISLEPLVANIDQSYGQYLVNVIKSLDAGPAVLAYLADNPKTAQQIVSSGAASATVALGRLDAQLAKPKEEKKEVKVTAAPEPPARTRGTNGQFAIPADTDDLDAFSRAFFKKKR